jgi:predicted O-methyltransferase YrrM
MFWENIEGFFDFQNIYDEAIKNFNSGATFVEIGVWKGKSTVYMAEKIKESGKNFYFYAIDPFTGEGEEYQSDIDVKNKTLLETYYKNIEPVKSYIQTLVGFSYELAHNFKNEDIDFLFIDGDHSYNGVKKDLQLWFPKIKKGGTIAGHDYYEQTCGVSRAVDEFFPKIKGNGSSWVFNK